MSRLHLDGYLIHHGIFKSDEEKVTQLKKRAKFAHRIFNTNKNDGKRGQIDLGNLTTLIGEVKNFLKTEYPNHSLTEWNLLKSKPGCQVQMAHCDYVPDYQLATVGDANYPLSAIVAIMDNTVLRVWPRSIRYSCINPSFLKRSRSIHPIDVKLEMGDVLVFRGDLVHAGMSYQQENIRMHVYLDHQDVIRTPNRTWIIRKDANEPLKRIIKE